MSVNVKKSSFVYSVGPSALKPGFTCRWLGASGVVALALVFLAVFLAPSAGGQNIQVGTIHGRVSDQTGATIQGATVTLTSPELPVQQTATTSADGLYHFEELAVGTYRLTFSQAGFKEFVRENVEITAGFSAEINVSMTVGAVTQSVTVSAAGPVVDTTSTVSSSDLSAPIIRDEMPITRTMGEVAVASPGMTATQAPDLGGGTRSSGQWVSYGLVVPNTSLLEGISTNQSQAEGGDSWDMASLQEFQVIPAAANAEIASPGATLIGAVQSGSNAFHGRVEVRGETNHFESNNLTPYIRSQGTTTDTSIVNAVDADAYLGGRIIKDKLWFFGGYHINSISRTDVGYVVNGQPGYIYQRESNSTGKGDYQLNKDWKLVGFYTIFTEFFPNNIASALVPQLNTQHEIDNPHNWKGELQGTPTSKLVVDFLVGQHAYLVQYFEQPNPLGIPTQIDVANQINNGPTTVTDKRGRTSWQVGGSVSYLPAGSFLGHHELKAGSTWYIQSQATNQASMEAGNYQLVFNQGVPSEIVFFNYPISNNQTRLNAGGGYVEDTWRITSRVTANIGLRIDRFSAFDPAQMKTVGNFGPPWVAPASGANPNLYTGGSVNYQEVNAGAWTNPAPRVGVVWDLRGDGKTAVKASYGRYNWNPGDDFASVYNPNSASNTTYHWTEAEAGCTNSLTSPYTPVAISGGGYCNYTPGTVNLNPNGPAFITTGGGDATVISGGSAQGTAQHNTTLNPSLKQQYTNEFQAQVERQLGPGLSAKVAYTYAYSPNEWIQVPYLQPYSAWSTPIVIHDAGPTAVPSLTNTVGPAITVYDLNPAFHGSNFTTIEFMNKPGDRTDHFSTIEATLIKRPGSAKWNMWMSYVATKAHRWFTPGNSTQVPGSITIGNALLIPENPDQNFFPLDTTWSWNAVVGGDYKLPWKFDFAGTYQLQNGLLGQRVSTIPLPVAGNTLIALGPWGSEEGPVRSLMNIRIARDFHRDKWGTFRPSIEILNTLNSSSPWAITYTSGKSFGKYTSLDNPRIVRGNFVWEF